MNRPLLTRLIDRSLARDITFAEIVTTLACQAIESYHVDFLRNEYRYYATNGDSFVTTVAMVHDGVAHEFSAEKLEAVNRRVQAKTAWYPDFVAEAAKAGCAYYIVYVRGRKIRYFGRDGDEYIQHFPGASTAPRDAPALVSAR
jgi:uncharacterized protein YbcV (DUF1398 family)